MWNTESSNERTHLRGMDYASPAQICAATVRKFVVIRTLHGLFSYTNFEPATALRCFKSTTPELF